MARPFELTARTAKLVAALATSMRVSKPRRAALATGASDAASDPASTCQRATVVAPFQLA